MTVYSNPSDRRKRTHVSGHKDPGPRPTIEMRPAEREALLDYVWRLECDGYSPGYDTARTLRRVAFTMDAALKAVEAREAVEREQAEWDAAAPQPAVSS